MWKEYHLGHNLSVKVTRIQAPSLTVDNSDSTSIFTGNPTVNLNKPEFAAQHNASRLIDFIHPKSQVRRVPGPLNISSLTADRAQNQGSTPELGRAGSSSPKGHGFQLSGSPQPFPPSAARRTGLSLHTRHISSETELTNLQNKQQSVHRRTAVWDKTKGNRTSEHKGMNRRQTLSDIPKTVVPAADQSKVRREDIQSESREIGLISGLAAPWHGFDDRRINAYVPNSFEEKKGNILASMSGEKRKAVFEGTFRAPPGDVSVEDSKAHQISLGQADQRKQVSKSSIRSVLKSITGSQPHQRKDTVSSIGLSFRREASESATQTIEDEINEDLLKQTLKDLESQWQKVFMQGETTDSALGLLNKDLGVLGDKLNQSKVSYVSQVEKLEDKLFHHWKRVLTLINEEEVKARVERYIDILATRSKKRSQSISASSPSPLARFEKRKGSYFSGKGSLAEDSLNLKDESAATTLKNFLEQIQQSEMVMKENKQLIGYLEQALQREEIPMMAVIHEVPWLQELKAITQNMTEYRLADESRYHEYLARAEEIEFKILSLVSKSGGEKSMPPVADLMGLPEDYLGAKFTLEAAESAARSVHSVQLLGLCTGTKERVWNYMRNLESTRISDPIERLASLLQQWGHDDSAQIANELETLFRRENKVLLAINSFFLILEEAISQKRPIHAYAIDYLKYLFEVCERHLPFLLPALNEVIDPPVLTFAKLEPISEPLSIIRNLVLRKLKLRYCESILHKIDSAERALKAISVGDHVLAESSTSDTSRIKKSYDLATQIALLNELAAQQEALIRSELGSSVESHAVNSDTQQVEHPEESLDRLRKEYHVYYLSSLVARHKANLMKTANICLSLPRSELLPAYPGELSNLAFKYEELKEQAKLGVERLSSDIEELSKKQNFLKDKSNKIHQELENVSVLKHNISKQLEKGAAPHHSSTVRHTFSKYSSSTSGLPQDKPAHQGVVLREVLLNKPKEPAPLVSKPQIPSLLKVPVDLSMFRRNPSQQRISASSHRQRRSSRNQSGSAEVDRKTHGLSRVNTASRTTLRSRGSNKENVSVTSIQQGSRPGSQAPADFLSKLTGAQISKIKDVQKSLIKQLSSTAGKDVTKSQLSRKILKHLDVTSSNPGLFNLLAQGIFFSIPVKKGPKLKSGYTGVKKVDVQQLVSKFSQPKVLGGSSHQDESVRSQITAYLEKLGFQHRDLKVDLDNRSVQFLNLSKMISTPMKRAASPDSSLFRAKQFPVQHTQQGPVKEGLHSPIELMKDYNIHMTEASKKLLQDLMSGNRNLLSLVSSGRDQPSGEPPVLFVWEMIAKDMSHSHQVIFSSLEKVLSGILACCAAGIPI